MFLRGEASDHCYHFESFEICQVCKATLELSRNSEYVCLSVSLVSEWSSCVGSANAFNSSNLAFDNERKRNHLTRRESISMFACVEEDRVPQMMFRLNSFTGSSTRVHRTSTPGILAFLLRHARLQQALS